MAPARTREQHVCDERCMARAARPRPSPGQSYGRDGRASRLFLVDVLAVDGEAETFRAKVYRWNVLDGREEVLPWRWLAEHHVRLLDGAQAAERCHAITEAPRP